MSAKLDIITLRGLTAEGIHGVFEFEHAAPQPFVIDIALWVDTTDAISSDDIADTVSYADVANDVVAVVEGPPAHLIETLAQRISDVLLANPRVEGLEVTVHKPQAPLEQEFTDVAVTVRRGNTPGTIARIRDITVVDGKVAPEADEPLVGFGGPDEAPALPSLVESPPTPAAPLTPQTPLQEPQSHPFVLALGGNVGDVPVTLAAAVSHLIDIPRIHIHDVSPLLRTHAVLAPGQAPQDDHWNAVILGSTTLTPHELLNHTAGIEAALGRERHEHWGPRSIDIDIISMGDLHVSDATLTIPHPRAHLRAFVLAPWLLIDPEATLPGFGSIDDLLSRTADLNGIVDAVDDWLESPEGIQAESDSLVAAGGHTRESSPGAEPQPVLNEPSTLAEIPGMSDPARPLVIPPIAVPEIAQPLALSRLDRLDPSSKASLQPDQGADLLWHKVWNSWAQTPIEPEDIPQQPTAENEPGNVTRQRETPSVTTAQDQPPVQAHAPRPATPSSAPPSSPPVPASPIAAVSPAVSLPRQAPTPTPAASAQGNGHRLDFVVSPGNPATSHETRQGVPSRTEAPHTEVASAAEGPAVAQPLPFQQVLVDDAVLEENPGHRPMRWAPLQHFDADPSGAAGSGHAFSGRTVNHPSVPGSRAESAVADEARARAELERIEAQRAEEARRRALRQEEERRERERLAQEEFERERRAQEQYQRERLAREQREIAAREATRLQEEAVRAETARIEAERIAAQARAAAEREATRRPLPKRTAQYAPLPEDGPRASSENLTRGHGVDGADYGSAAEMGERPLPQWDFSSAKVTIVDDSSEGGRNATPRASLLAPDLPEGTLTGAVTDLPSATGMLDRVTMRPTATGMIPVVKRDTQHP
ncbi:2-amino-4-hydroxy-6-hydroxymethyldihydropteridine diphosphokinase [Schaalia canis]|uniref:Bifunctional folate synthesis protein n=1 Tax=Schaalia canis TaxID=100469 RepID=A0A3P1SFN8_9ACTO|nr:2-amino-4-hydroxy-6-hydroxymethyldihydropteridine diphosphokinase [Schaalia canis]RRC95797.1 2-amino-4-hydroxy-6-hydroxymethyldihydropteridine diphosphokinase [Schaalia canis]